MLGKGRLSMARKTIVAFDTNILFSAWSIYRWTRFREIIEHLKGAVFVPSVVCHEIGHHWQIQHDAEVKHFTESCQRLASAPSYLGFVIPEILRSQVREMRQAFKPRKCSNDALQSHLQAMFGPQIYFDTDFNVTSENLLLRYQSGRRPFRCPTPVKNVTSDRESTSVRGWQDALIWESILQQARLHRESNFVFITANTDFMSNDKKLHQDLIDDLVLSNLRADQICILPSVSAFVSDQSIINAGLGADLTKDDVFLGNIVTELKANPELDFVIRNDLENYNSEAELDADFTDFDFDCRMIRVDVVDSQVPTQLLLTLSLRYLTTMWRHSVINGREALIKEQQKVDFAILNLRCDYSEDNIITNVRDLWTEPDSSTSGYLLKLEHNGMGPSLIFKSLTARLDKEKQFSTDAELKRCLSDFRDPEDIFEPKPYSLLQKWDLLPEP